MSNGFLIYIRGLKGPEAQKWMEPPREGCTYWHEKMIGQPIPLQPGEWRLPWHVLERLYPCQKIEETP